MPATSDDDLRLLHAFAAYARRQLRGEAGRDAGGDAGRQLRGDAGRDRDAGGDRGGEVVVVGFGESLRRAPAGAEIAVVAGRRSAAAERLFALRSGMRAQWRGRAHAEPGSPGVDFAVWDRWRLDRVPRTPEGFDVLAVITTYNEADIIEQVLDFLLAGRVRVHVIDNWSTDGTETLLERYVRPGVLSMERFPAEGPSPYFDLRTMMRRVSEVAHGSGADWVVHHDADEIHISPWPHVSLRDALWAVERWGFNCIDHTAVEFRPVDERWQPKDDLLSSFDWFEFGPDPGHFTLYKGWKPQPQLVSNAESGGHSVDFPGRRVFPYKFPTRHYSIRSTAQARKKLFRDRRPRWSPEEKAMGWHVHYDDFDETSTFVWDKSQLYRWDSVDDELLLQRLSGVGLPNNPRAEETISR